MLIEKINFNGYRIGIPIPFPMKYVYCYLFPQDEGYVVIDTGLNDVATRNAWKQVFHDLKIDPNEIKTIYLTHFHPDHSGLCGWMQQWTGAEVYMHEIDMEMMEQVWGKESIQAQQVGEMTRKHGTPQPLSEKIIEHMDRLQLNVLPLPNINPIATEVAFAGEKWQVIHTPGHSAGHICFFQEAERILISGDHILDKISPNISVWPGASQAPLHEYIQSLIQIKALQVKLAYPGHGKIIDRVNERIDELIEHHQHRLEAMEELASGKTAYEIAETIFASKKLNPHQWRFAIAETIAHLNYLTAENRINKGDSTPVVFEKTS